MAPLSWAPFKWPLLWGTALQQSPASCPEHSTDFPRTCTPWKSLLPICLTYMLLQQTPALVFISSTWSSQAVYHPNTIQAQCCLTSVFEWELVFPTWRFVLTEATVFSMPCRMSWSRITKKLFRHNQIIDHSGSPSASELWRSQRRTLSEAPPTTRRQRPRGERPSLRRQPTFLNSNLILAQR